MNNQMTIQENYNTQLEMTLEGIQKIASSLFNV